MWYTLSLSHILTILISDYSHASQPGQVTETTGETRPSQNWRKSEFFFVRGFVSFVFSNDLLFGRAQLVERRRLCTRRLLMTRNYRVL